MNRLQKIAWFNLVFAGLAVMASLVAVAVIGGLYGWPKAFAGFGFLGIAGLGALALLIYKKPQNQAVELDERD